MIPTKTDAHFPEALCRALLDVSRALEFVLTLPSDNVYATVHALSDDIARGALLCRVIARTLCVEPEATLLSAVLRSMEDTSDD